MYPSQKEYGRLGMRTARIRYDDGRCYYHVMNRVAGYEGQYPFGDAEKEKMFRLAERLSVFYQVDILCLVVMGNHFHAICMTYPDPPDRTDMMQRWRDYYGNRRAEPNWDSPAVRARIGARMRDISMFLKDLQQSFASWFNETRTIPRHGRLWADRFKSVILERGAALWEAIKYVALNPVRAGLCRDAADYRFGTLGRLAASGRHAFGGILCVHLRELLGYAAEDFTDEQVMGELYADITRVTASEAGKTPEETLEAMQRARARGPVQLHLMRRLRYWSYGAIIGSKLFVMNLSGILFGNNGHSGAKQFTRGETADGRTFYAYRQLRGSP